MKVFVSYSHDSPEHMNRVLELCNRLRADGVDCAVDQYEMSPAEGWPRWTNAQIEEASYVLVVCTEAYGRRFRGEALSGIGLGVKWEGAVITQSLYDAEAGNNKFIPVLFSPQDAAHVPKVLRGTTRYEVTGDEGYERLYRRIRNQPEVSKPLLGKLRPLPPLERRQEFRALSESLGTAVYGDRGGPAGPASRRERPARRTASKRIGLALFALPTVAAVAVLLVLVNRRVPTHVRAELMVSRVAFTLGGAGKTAVLNSSGLKSVVIEKFDLVKFKPESLAFDSRAAQGHAAREPSAPPTGAPGANLPPVVIKPKDERFQSNVSFVRGVNGRAYPLTMGDVSANPSSEITLESTEDANDLIMRIDGGHSSGSITAAGPLKVDINQCEVSGVGGYRPEESSVTLRANLLSDSSIEFDGQPDSLVLTMTVPPEKSIGLFPREAIPVTAIRFERQSERNGEVLSSILKDGELSYPGYEKIDKRKIASTEFISLSGLEKFSIEEMKLDPSDKGIRLTLQGVADSIKSGSSDFMTDRRLTAYDAASNEHQAWLLFGAVCWAFVTSAGAYKLLREK